MLKLKFALIATGISIDIRTNNLTIFNQLDRISIPNNAAVFSNAQMELAIVFRNESAVDEMIPISIDLISPSGTSTVVAKSSLTTKGNVGHRFFVALQDLKFTELGIYRFLIQWESEKAEVELLIVKDSLKEMLPSVPPSIQAS